ncbi:MAG: CBS domain-containing protein [Halobacteriaceae archaeon]
MQARDIMTSNVESVTEDESVSDVLTKMARRNYNGFPVVNDEGELVGIVTQRDLVDIFQPSDRTLWIPIGLPPFLETVTYGFDLSWDELDTELDLMKNANRPVKEIMSVDVKTVRPDASLNTIIEILALDDRDINRIPVVENDQVIGIITREDVIKTIWEADLITNE